MKEYPTKDDRVVVIRQAEEKDIEGVIDVMDSVGSEGYMPAERLSSLQKELIAGSIKEKAGLFVVAEIHGRIVGEGSLHPKRFRSKSQHVVELGMNIKKGFREIGIGNAMMDYIISWTKKKGFEKISLSVFSTNQRAVNLYKKFGFKIEGVKKREFKMNGDYIAEILMALFL